MAGIVLAGLWSASPAISATGFAVGRPAPIGAQDLIVTNLQDSGAGSLRAAINSVPGGESARISFAGDVRGQIALSGPLSIDSTGTITISGPGVGALRISGNGVSRVFVVSSSASLRLTDLTVTRGSVVGPSTEYSAAPGEPGEGGAIFNGGTLSLTQVNVTDSSAMGGSSRYSKGGPGYGGGIYSTGVLSITRCLFSGNRAIGSSDHGQGYSFSDKLSGGDAAGGAIRNEGRLMVTESEFRDNSAYGANGVRVSFPVTAGSLGTEGGSALGGAIFDAKSSDGLEVRNSTFAGNLARAGGAGEGSVRPYPGGDAAGGAVFSLANGVVLTQSTVVSNWAALDSIQGETKRGRLGAGGLELRGDGRLYSDTIAFNRGSADVETVRPISTESTIVGSCAGAGLESTGFNLDFRDSCNLSAATDLRNVDAGLGSLSDEGGPTRTIPLSPASPAVDAGSSTMPTDQRGDERPIRFSDRALPPGGNASDIGAFELQRDGT